MNDKQAKKLRRVVFGDKAFRGTKEYMAVRHERKARLVDIPNSGGLMLDVTPFTVILTPETPHSNYRTLKRIFGRR